MNRSSHSATGVTSAASPIRRGNQRARTMPAVIETAAVLRATPRPATPDTAPQNADPIANEPSALTVCNATARERTHGGALVCVAVLKVAITAIQAAPPIANAANTTVGMR